MLLNQAEHDFESNTIYTVLSSTPARSPPCLHGADWRVRQPEFNAGMFNQQLAKTVDKTSVVVNQAQRLGTNGFKLAKASMKSIRDHPCEQTPAPGCVIP